MNLTTKKLTLEGRFMLDSIFDTVRDFTSRQITNYLLENPALAESLREYCELIKGSDYPENRANFLMHIKDTYLG